MQILFSCILDAESRTIKSQLLALMKSPPNWFDEIHDPKIALKMRLVAPVSRRLFFSLGASRFVDAPSPRTISIDEKKYPLVTQGSGRWKKYRL